MQRAAIAIPFAFIMLAVSAAVPNPHYASAVQEPETAVSSPAVQSSENEIVPVVPSAPEPAGADSQAPRRASMEEICATLHAAANAHDLPLPFFARLIWQESRFRADAVSRAGARGIAQFMPATANERGLDDPHDPIQSLRKSAGFLRDLRNQFGNLGLAAAAYNGGPGRVQAWLRGRKDLPTETRDYVRIVTGIPADQWRGRENADAVHSSRIPASIPCPVLVAVALQDEPVTVTGPAHQAAAAVQRAAAASEADWSVVIAGSFSKRTAESQSARLERRFGSVLKGRKLRIVSRRVAGRGKAQMSQVRIPGNDRAGAEWLCAKLRAGGASCTVVRTS
jgi:hypothetical protein